MKNKRKKSDEKQRPKERERERKREDERFFDVWLFSFRRFVAQIKVVLTYCKLMTINFLSSFLNFKNTKKN